MNLLALHEQAMRLNDAALADARAGRATLARVGFRLALYLEGGVAVALAPHAPEPTRSTLLRSAAVLAVSCGERRLADSLIAEAFKGCPPPEEVDQLLQALRLGPQLVERG